MSDRSLPDLKAGVYQHYKGHRFLILGYANDKDQEGRVVVVYVGLEFDGATKPIRMHVQTAEDFFAFVDPLTGETPATNWTPGVLPVPRFTYLGPEAWERR